MSQKAFLAEMDADLHAAFADAGLADAALYQAPGAETPTPCRVYVDRAVQPIGEFGHAIVPRTAVRILKADVNAVPGAAVIVDGDSFVLDAIESEDDASIRFWVTP